MSYADFTHTVILPGENLVAEGVRSLIVAGATQFHLYCGVCGDVWLHAINDHPSFRHDYSEHRCAKCGNGSLAPHFRLTGLPLAFLRREVILRRNPLKTNSGLTYAELHINEP